MTVATNMTWGKLRKRIGIIIALANAFGAAMLFIYFAIVEPGTSVGAAERLRLAQSLVFCVVVVTLIITVFLLAIRQFYRFLLNNPSSVVESGDMEQLRKLAGRILSIPPNIAIFCLIGWLIGGLIFTYLYPAYQILHNSDSQQALRLLIGMYFVAAPTTMALVFFLLEWCVRDAVVKLLPSQALLNVPSSRRINVLPKTFLVAFMIGVVPLSIVSVIALEGITTLEGAITSQSVIKIQDILLKFDEFATHMRIILVFLFILAVCTITIMSLLMSRSVSGPIKLLGNAVNQIGKGDLNVSVPVVSNDEIGHVSSGFNTMVEGLRERDIIRDTFGLYVSHEVAAEILRSRGTDSPSGELRDITILVADLRGFTKMTEMLEPRLVLTIVNRFLEAMTEVIIKHEGTIDEFTGDGVLVFFGAPRAVQDHVRQAVSCALEMQDALDELNRRSSDDGLPELRMGIGVNCGELVVGHIGSEKRRKYGAVGNPINIAFRVEAQAAEGEIIVTDEVYQLLNEKLVVGSTRNAVLKGIEKPSTLYQIVAFNKV